MSGAVADAVERAVAEIWRDVLGIEQVGREDDFFALGGSSLTAMQITARAATAFDVELDLEVVFEAPTVAALAQRIAAAGRAAAPRRQRRREAELSEVQRIAWAQDVCNPSTMSHVTEAFTVEGPLDVGVLGRAFTEVVRRHEILRTIFPRAGHGTRPRVLPAAPLEVPLVDVGRTARRQRDVELRRLVRAAQGDPFDYATRPPVRIRAIRSARQSHVVVVAVHEIVCDGVGFGLLLSELSRLYDAFLAGRPSPLAEPELQYFDCAPPQGGSKAAAGERYWEELLRRAPMALPFPFEAGGLATPSDRYVRSNASIPRSLSDELRELARREAVTPAMLHLTVFCELLRRHSGARSMLVDVPAAERPRVELERVIGYFSRVLPVWVDLGGDPTVSEALRRTRGVMLDALRHAGELPEPARRRELAGTRGLESGGVKFRYTTAADEPRFEIAGARTARIMQPGEVGVLVLAVTESAGGGTLVELSSTDASLDEAALGRLHEHHDALLRAAAATPDAPLSALTMLSAAERRRLVAEWNPRRGDADEPRRLHELVREHAERAPDGVAVHAPGAPLSWRELGERTARLASHLRGWGVGAGIVVGVALDPSVELVTALLAVLEAGGVARPVRSGAAVPAVDVVVTDGADAAAGFSGPVVDLTVQREAIATATAHEADPTATPDDVALLIETAGVTGPPKLVRLTHGRLAHVAGWQRDAYRLLPADRALDVPGPGVRTWALAALSHLAGGVQVVVPAGPRVADASEVARAVAEHGATVCGLTPTLASALLADAATRSGSLRLLLVRGPGAVALPAGEGPSPAVVREYALAEAGGVVLSERASRTAGAASARVYVLDGDGAPAPVGAVGEVHVAGCGIVAGEGTVADPLADEPRAAMARTGDLGRRRPDGTVELLARADDEVRFRGFRLNATLTEIEAALVRHPAVRAAAACWDGATASVVAFAIPAAAGLPDRDELARWLRRTAPDGIPPVRCVPIEALPARADGSVDRALLAQTASEHAAHDASRGGSRTSVERKLAGIWRKLLGRRRIGVQESFFELGGDLYLGVELIGRANDAGLRLSMDDLLRDPTIAGLAVATGAADDRDGARVVRPRAGTGA
jgi:non-ribosomal peptide synthetase component F/acyl carrier protein